MVLPDKTGSLMERRLSAIIQYEMAYLENE
jgi:hypothetical protein